MPSARKPKRTIKKALKIGRFSTINNIAQWYKNRQELLKLKPTPQYILNVLKKVDPQNHFFRNVDLSNARIEPDKGTPAINIFFNQRTTDPNLFGRSVMHYFPGIGIVPINFINTAHPKLAVWIKKHERQHVRTYAHRLKVEKEGLQALSEAILHELISCLAEEKHPTSKRELNTEINRLRRKLVKKIDGLIEIFKESGYRDDLLEHLRAHNLTLLKKNLNAIREATEFLPLGEIRMVVANSHWSLIEPDLQKRIALVQKYKERKKNR
jgi:hypothetical protein